MSYVICDKMTMELESPSTFKSQWQGKAGAKTALKRAAERKQIYNKDNFGVFKYKDYIKAKYLTL